MQYFSASMLALAVSASAAPQWSSRGSRGHWPSFPWGNSNDDYESGPESGPPVPSISFPASGSIPSGTSGAGPIASASSVYAPSFVVASSSAVLLTTAAPLVDTDSGSFSSGSSLPASSGTSVLSAVQTIAAGDSFDGGMVTYDRGVSCTGQEEGGSDDTVFTLEEGASLSNVIIGPNQIEGIHCLGACTLTNVWWSEVCEDAFTIKEQDEGAMTTITGGGAFGAEDKVLQHNGGGSLTVTGFTVDDFGKLYRSCGNCDSMPERHVVMDDITATSGSSLVGELRSPSSSFDWFSENDANRSTAQASTPTTVTLPLSPTSRLPTLATFALLTPATTVAMSPRRTVAGLARAVFTPSRMLLPLECSMLHPPNTGEASFSSSESFLWIGIGGQKCTVARRWERVENKPQVRGDSFPPIVLQPCPVI